MHKKKADVVITNPWHTLRRFTDARIGLGRAGHSLPTQPHLAFQLAHAQARDAVHLPLDTDQLTTTLQAQGYQSLQLHSAAPDRAAYLQRPDWGRRLDATSQQSLKAQAAKFDLVFVIADGLSALAVHKHAVAMLDTVAPHLKDSGWKIAPVIIIEQGRVAVGDEVASILGAETVIMLIGERPGLSSPDSLGLYLSFRPQPGTTTDADRNCISNIRAEGLSYEVAAHKLRYLLTEARQRQLSGVRLKDEAAELTVLADNNAQKVNFLVSRQVEDKLF